MIRSVKKFRPQIGRTCNTAGLRTQKQRVAYAATSYYDLDTNCPTTPTLHFYFVGVRGSEWVQRMLRAHFFLLGNKNLIILNTILANEYKYLLICACRSSKSFLSDRPSFPLLALGVSLELDPILRSKTRECFCSEISCIRKQT